MNKKDNDIERKLQELESAVLKEEVDEKAKHPAKVDAGTGLKTSGTNSDKAELSKASLQNDLYYFGGVGLIMTGLFMLFNHVKVGTSMLTAFGFGGAGSGLVLIPLLIGIGWLIYDSKNRYAWLLTAATCALIFFSILSSMLMTFPTMTLLGTIMMLAPLAIGTALLLKGMGGAKGIEDKMKK
jgi:hypothetical protein